MAYFFAIWDRDFLTENEKGLIENTNSKIFVWNKYHIENYLLDFDIIHTVLERNLVPNLLSSSDDVRQKMKKIVIDHTDYYLSKMTNQALNDKIGSIYFDVGFPDVAEHAITQAEKIRNRIGAVLDSEKIKQVVALKVKEFNKAIDEEKWMDVFPGRYLLKQFLTKYSSGLAYEQFKNQITREIADQNKIPNEISTKIKSILTNV